MTTISCTSPEPRQTGLKARFLPGLFAAALLAATIACAPLIARFDAQSYSQAVALKVDALALMDSAAEPYAPHEAEAKALAVKLDKAFEYAQGKPRNELSARQWQILKDPQRHLLGGFLTRWKAESTLGHAYILEKKGQVGMAFDQIIGLESGKLKPADVAGTGA
ncbi:MAG TPA: hypothetical protein VF378_04405 [Geothrix sp.]